MAADIGRGGGLGDQASETMWFEDGPGRFLTKREREVIVLAAQCRSGDIATRLGLSVNTVNNYLARAYTKLGISGRRDLAGLLTTRRHT